MDSRSSETSQKKVKNSKADCFTILKQTTKLKCVNSEFRSSSLSQKGFPQVGPWHHVGTTMEITLEKNWIIEVIRWELNPVNVQSNKIIDPR